MAVALFRVQPISVRTGIVFSGLPSLCQLRIYTLDGDLIWLYDHDRSGRVDPGALVGWNLGSRSGLLPASGIYYWVMTTPFGASQRGKLVLVM